MRCARSIKMSCRSRSKKRSAKEIASLSEMLTTIWTRAMTNELAMLTLLILRLVTSIKCQSREAFLCS